MEQVPPFNFANQAEQNPINPDVVSATQRHSLSQLHKRHSHKRDDYNFFFYPYYHQSAKEMFEALHSEQLKYHPPNYMIGKQRADKVTVHSRALLIHGLIIPLVKELELSWDVIFLAVNFLDRFFSKIHAKHSALPMVALACISIASKKEVRTIPVSIPLLINKVRGEKFLFVNFKPVTLELYVLKTLDYRLEANTGFHFLHCIKQMCLNDHHLELKEDEYINVSYTCEAMAEYAIINYQFMQFPPVTRACTFLHYAILPYYKCSEEEFFAWALNVCYVNTNDLQNAIACVRRTHIDYPQLRSKLPR